MKKQLLSTLIPVLLFSAASNAAEIYKAEDGSHVDLYSRLGFNITNKGTNDQDTRGVFDGRIGLSGAQTINEHADVIGMAQYQVGAAEYANSLNPGSSDFTARYVWAGIDGHEYGAIKGGRVDSGLIMFTDIGDVFATSDVSMARQASMIDATAVQVFRQDGTLQYQNSIGNFDVAAAYIFGNDTSALDYGYNAAVRYTLDMGDAGTLAPVISYQKTKADDSNINSDAEYQFWGVGTRYYLNKLMLGALYSQDEVDGIYAGTSTDKVMEFTAVYDFNDDWAFRAGYRSLENDDGDELELKDTTFEVQYKLTNMSSIYTTYELRNGENGRSLAGGGVRDTGFGGDADENFYSVGIRFEI
ncbi:porin [Vibrio sp. CK2-1]|uniref:porin n=1 Tax=Vibrio sp. CK2-1 TaxID=2912249 RepID=UPI001F1C9DE7|nr:porin [Vibrio sp. CK2-1]MCF7353353.1 porin [Vibrio sp. CK2-1]